VSRGSVQDRGRRATGYNPDAMLKTREDVAAELQRVRESVRERALHPRAPGELLPASRATRPPSPPAGEPPVEPGSPPPRPDASEVNAHWLAQAPPARGLWGVLSRLVLRLVGPRLAAQVEWNAKQVRLDNEILDYVDARFAATHRHYDAVLGHTGRHLGEIDERHMILQEELVAHVHDLVKRIDLVLLEAEKGRVGLEHGLRDVKRRLLHLEERLGRG
jgi:hypothetical protein